MLRTCANSWLKYSFNIYINDIPPPTAIQLQEKNLNLFGKECYFKSLFLFLNILFFYF